MLKLPQFNEIQPEIFPEQLDVILQKNQQTIIKLLQQTNFTWQNLIDPLDNLNDELNQFFSPLSHLNSVKSTEAIRLAYRQCLPKLTEYSTWLGQNEALYQAYHFIKLHHYSSLDAAQQKVIDHALRDFKLSGVTLVGESRERYQTIQHELAECQTQFEENIMDASDSFECHILDQAILAGLPETTLNLAAQKAKEKDLAGWMLTLDIPCYLAVMTYADDAELRETFYRAYNTRGSALFAEGLWDNTPLIQKILTLRLEKAKLLGFNTYAEYSLATKMATSTHEVFNFLLAMVKPLKIKAELEVKQLKEFANVELMSWDLPYFSEKLKQHLFQLKTDELRVYFPLKKVLAGMFNIVERLYGVTFKPKQTVQTWHPDVQFYEIYNAEDQLQGAFYLDLFSREKKRGGAWMDDCVTRRKIKHEIQLPVAYLTCNFSAPVQPKPALLTHDEVVTLFHEFGHGLHHLLTQQIYADVSGIHGVPWDAVELPSQFFENWCWSEESIALISEHYETGEPLPKTQLDQLLAAKNFQVAMQSLRQIEFSLYDFRLHHEFDPARQDQVETILNETRNEVAVIKPPAWNRFQNSFSHIFAGGYAAGYYSYKWAEVLSADAFGAFEEEGIFNPQTGQRFLDCILQPGGSVEPMQMFINFRGREPNVDALLKQDGII